MRSTAGASARERIAIDRDLIAALWLAAVLLCFGLSLFLTCRRLAGALVQPPGGTSLIVAAVGLALLASALRQMGRRDATEPVSFALPGVGSILLLAALTLPGTPAFGIFIAWLIVIAAEATAWRLNSRFLPRTTGRATAPSIAAPSPADDEPEISAGLIQQLTRTREGDEESLHALLRAEVAASDRLAIVHVAFCPPLADRPRLTAHALDADDAEVRITQVETFGVRIEVRLPRPASQPRSVLVEMLGSVIPPRRA